MRERNAEVNELNKIIALLNDRIKTSEVIIDQLGPLNASKNLEEHAVPTLIRKQRMQIKNYLTVMITLVSLP